jgi:hypothetical protein
MRDQLLLGISGDTLSLHWVQAQRPQGWLSRISRRALRMAPTKPLHHAVSLPLSLSLGQLGDKLDQAWTSLQKQIPPGSRRADLSVQLGLAHARLGLLHLNQDSSMGAESAIVNGYVLAWIRQMWGVDPATQIVRWERMENGRDVLISSIDRSIYAELEEFARRHVLRFVSCKPALLDALESRPAPMSDAPYILVWTEPSATAPRSPLVQLLQCTGPQARTLWRGWLPVSEHGEAPDKALQGAIRRFGAAYLSKMNAPVVFRHWDPALLTQHRVGAS